MPLAMPSAARRSRGTRISSLQYNGGKARVRARASEWRLNVRYGSRTSNSCACRLARYACLGLGSATLRLVLGIERSGYTHRALRLVPDLLVGEVREDAC